jgi:hypothetical protein
LKIVLSNIGRWPGAAINANATQSHFPYLVEHHPDPPIARYPFASYVYSLVYTLSLSLSLSPNLKNVVIKLK